MSDEKTTGKPNDETLLEEVRDFVDSAIKGEGHNRAPAAADLEFLVGDQWPEQVKAQRQTDGRPCLTFNKLPTFLHQVTNDQRQNTPGIKVHPVDSGADVKKAEIVQGIIRHIEYSSNADIAYDTAVNSAAAIGFGFWQLVTEYESAETFNQVIKFRRVRDALKVYFDPASIEADGSDAKRVAIVGDVPRQDFKRDYPDAEDYIATNYSALGDMVQQGWMAEDFVRVVEYYAFEYEKATICLLADGRVVRKSDLPEGTQTLNERPTMIPKLMWYKTTGCKVLDRTEIKCKWIPVFPVWGNETDIKGKVYRSGIIRAAKDPAQMYNYWMTCATEEVTLRPKSPYIGAEGQFEGYEADWAQANTRNFAFLEYKPVSLEGIMAPPPQRQQMADVPVGMLQMAMHASDAIKAVTGLFDSSLGARGNATSGRQEREQARQGDTANFHYTDNLNRSIRHCGRCLVDMIPSYYDAQRVVRILKEDGKTVESVPINQQQVDPTTQQVTAVLNDLTVGTYDVTVTPGPSYATQRQEAAETLVDLSGNFPGMLQVAGDLVVEAMDFPGADKVAQRLKRAMPPEITKDEDEEGGGQPAIPPEVEQALQNADQMVDQLTAELEKAKAGNDAKLEQARISAEVDIEVARIKAQSDANVAEIQAGALMDKEELITLRAQLAHHQRLAENDQKAEHQQEAAEQSAEHQHEAGEVAHQHAVEQTRLAASQAADKAQSGPTDEKSGT